MKTREEMKNLTVHVVMNAIRSAFSKTNIPADTIKQVTEPIETLLGDIIDGSLNAAATNETLDTSLQDLIADGVKNTLKEKVKLDDLELNQLIINSLFMALSVRQKSDEIVKFIRKKLQEAAISEDVINRLLETIIKIVSYKKSSSLASEQLKTEINETTQNASSDNDMLKELITGFVTALLSEKFDANQDAINIASTVFNNTPKLSRSGNVINDYVDTFSDDQKKTIRNSLVIAGITIIGFVMNLLSPLFGKITLADLGLGALKMAGKTAATATGNFLRNNIVSPLKNGFDAIASFLSNLFVSKKNAKSTTHHSTQSINETLQENCNTAESTAPASPAPQASEPQSPSTGKSWFGSLASYASSFFKAAPTPATVSVMEVAETPTPGM